MTALSEGDRVFHAMEGRRYGAGTVVRAEVQKLDSPYLLTEVRWDRRPKSTMLCNPGHLTLMSAVDRLAELDDA